MTSLAHILISCHVPSKAWMDYSQLHHFLRSLPSLDSITRPHTDLEIVLFQSAKPEHSLCVLYQLLLRELYFQTPCFLLEWEDELAVFYDDMNL